MPVITYPHAQPSDNLFENPEMPESCNDLIPMIQVYPVNQLATPVASIRLIIRVYTRANDDAPKYPTMVEMGWLPEQNMPAGTAQLGFGVNPDGTHYWISPCTYPSNGDRGIINLGVPSTDQTDHTNTIFRIPHDDMRWWMRYQTGMDLVDGTEYTFNHFTYQLPPQFMPQWHGETRGYYIEYDVCPHAVGHPTSPEDLNESGSDGDLVLNWKPQGNKGDEVFCTFYNPNDDRYWFSRSTITERFADDGQKFLVMGSPSTDLAYKQSDPTVYRWKKDEVDLPAPVNPPVPLIYHGAWLTPIPIPLESYNDLPYQGYKSFSYGDYLYVKRDTPSGIVRRVKLSDIDEDANSPKWVGKANGDIAIHTDHISGPLAKAVGNYGAVAYIHTGGTTGTYIKLKDNRPYCSYRIYIRKEFHLEDVLSGDTLCWSDPEGFHGDNQIQAMSHHLASIFGEIAGTFINYGDKHVENHLVHEYILQPEVISIIVENAEPMGNVINGIYRIKKTSKDIDGNVLYMDDTTHRNIIRTYVSAPGQNCNDGNQIAVPPPYVLKPLVNEMKCGGNIPNTDTIFWHQQMVNVPEGSVKLHITIPTNLRNPVHGQFYKSIQIQYQEGHADSIITKEMLAAKPQIYVQLVERLEDLYLNRITGDEYPVGSILLKTTYDYYKTSLSLCQARVGHAGQFEWITNPLYFNHLPRDPIDCFVKYVQKPLVHETKCGNVPQSDNKAVYWWSELDGTMQTIKIGIPPDLIHNAGKYEVYTSKYLTTNDAYAGVKIDTLEAHNTIYLYTYGTQIIPDVVAGNYNDDDIMLQVTYSGAVSLYRAKTTGNITKWIPDGTPLSSNRTAMESCYKIHHGPLVERDPCVKGVPAASAAMWRADDGTTYLSVPEASGQRALWKITPNTTLPMSIWSGDLYQLAGWGGLVEVPMNNTVIVIEEPDTHVLTTRVADAGSWNLIPATMPDCCKPATVTTAHFKVGGSINTVTVSAALTEDVSAIVDSDDTTSMDIPVDSACTGMVSSVFSPSGFPDSINIKLKEIIGIKFTAKIQYSYDTQNGWDGVWKDSKTQPSASDDLNSGVVLTGFSISDKKED